MTRTLKQQPTEAATTEPVSVPITPVATESPDDTLFKKMTKFSDYAEVEGNKLTAYIEKQIKEFDDRLLYNGDNNITFDDLNLALSTYEQTLFAVTALYVQAKFDADVAAQDYNFWYADKYTEIRKMYNNKDVKNSSWLSAKEIDAVVLTTFKDEAMKLKAISIEKDSERSYMERLCKGWMDYQFVLGQLSKNAIAELGGSKIGIDIPKGDEVYE